MFSQTCTLVFLRPLPLFLRPLPFVFLRPLTVCVSPILTVSQMFTFCVSQTFTCVFLRPLPLFSQTFTFVFLRPLLLYFPDLMSTYPPKEMENYNRLEEPTPGTVVVGMSNQYPGHSTQQLTMQEMPKPFAYDILILNFITYFFCCPVSPLCNFYITVSFLMLSHSYRGCFGRVIKAFDPRSRGLGFDTINASPM